MKIIFIIFFSVSLFVLSSCNEYSFEEATIINEPKVVAIQIDPVVTCPGCDITVSVLADRGDSYLAPFRLKIGNNILENKGEDQFEMTIPAKISEWFGEEKQRKYRADGFVDVALEVELKDSPYKSVKLFRIAHEDRELEPFEVNPVLERVTYEIAGSAQPVDTINHSTIIFTPGHLSGNITFEAKSVKGDEQVLKEYEFEWFISGTSGDMPQLVNMDKKTGKAEFLFQDLEGAPVVGKFRFTLVVRPAKSFPDTKNARYGTDFHTFVFDTTGGPIDD